MLCSDTLERSVDGRRLVCIAELFRLVVPRVRDVHLCPRCSNFVVFGLSSRLVGIRDPDIELQVVVEVVVGVRYRLPLT